MSSVDSLLSDIRDLGNCFTGSADHNVGSLSLMSGLSGDILVQSVLYEYTLDPLLKIRIQENLELLISALEKDEQLKSTFSDGVAGIGWLFLYLDEKKIIQIDAEFLSELDLFLKDELAAFLAQQNYDILHGALGLGFYFLKRGDVAEVSKIIESLYVFRCVDDEGVKWSTVNRIRGLSYDFGLAHGQASTLYFLGKCYLKGVEIERTKEMIEGSIECYFNNIQHDHLIGAYFPNVIPVNEYQKFTSQGGSSRLAWCYGDLGVLHTLLLVTRWINAVDLRQKIERMLLDVAMRRDLKLCAITDAQLCHGSGGASSIFLSLFKLTGNEKFEQAADYWKNETLKMASDKSKGICGYLFDTVYSGYQPSSNFLTGAGGVLLSLISFEIGMTGWEECIFLS